MYRVVFSVGSLVRVYSCQEEIGVLALVPLVLGVHVGISDRCLCEGHSLLFLSTLLTQFLSLVVRFCNGGRGR